MIERLTPQQTRPLRRQMLSDTVYVIFHDVLKTWHKEGKTHLTPQEICLSARNLCHVILELPDMEEGIDDELDDLEDEVSDINKTSGYGEEDTDGDSADEMLIEMMAASMLTALSSKQEKMQEKTQETMQGKKHGKSSLKPVILHIMQRWCDHELFDTLLDEGCKKEEARLVEGKRNDLLRYELMELEREKGDTDHEMRLLIDQLLTPAYGRSVETIKELLLLLNRYNIEHHHSLDTPLLELYKRLDGTSQGVSTGGDNQGIMTGGNLNAGFHLTDPQAAMLAKAIAANGNQPLLTMS